MTRLILLLFLSAGCCLTEVQASELIADPEVDFVNTPEVVRAEFGILKKDRLLRLDLDLNGDGRPTIFLTFEGGGSKSGSVWTAYSPESSGYVRTDGIQFREDFFHAGIVPDLNPSGGLLVLYPGKGAGKLVRYPFSKGRVQGQEDLRVLDYSKNEDRELFERIFGRNLDEPMPREYFENPPHKVIDIKEINARANAPQITTPPPVKTPSVVESTPVAETPTSAVIEKAIAPATPTLSSMAAESTPAPSVLPIVPVAIIVAVILGVVIYVLRRKSNR